MAKEEGRKLKDGFIKSKMRFQETWLRLQINQDEKKKDQTKGAVILQLLPLTMAASLVCKNRLQRTEKWMSKKKAKENSNHRFPCK